MTNLLSTMVIVLTTNVTEKPLDIIGMVPCPDYTNGNIVCAAIHYGKVGEDPNTKVKTTTITEMILVTTVISGTNLVTKSERPLTNWVVTLKKEESWVPVK
jgi:hypothetical protein